MSKNSSVNGIEGVFKSWNRPPQAGVAIAAKEVNHDADRALAGSSTWGILVLVDSDEDLPRQLNATSSMLEWRDVSEYSDELDKGREGGRVNTSFTPSACLSRILLDRCKEKMVN